MRVSTPQRENRPLKLLINFDLLFHSLFESRGVFKSPFLCTKIEQSIDIKSYLKRTIGTWVMAQFKELFLGIEDPLAGKGNTEIPIPSVLLSGCAMFSLKFPSLLQFDQDRADGAIAHNLRHLFHLSKTPSDTQMRDILDKIDSEKLMQGFDVLFAKSQRGKVLVGFNLILPYS